MWLKQWKYFFNSFCYLFLLFYCYNAEKIIDMENYDCVRMNPFKITDYELVKIVAWPRRDTADRVSCQVTLKALENRYFNIYLKELESVDCGISFKFYDSIKQPYAMFKEFGCTSSAGAYFRSRGNVVIIEFQKLTSSNNAYRFYIVASTNKGPRIDRSSINSVVKNKCVHWAWILLLMLLYYTLF